jgi:hypothetical protein
VVEELVTHRLNPLDGQPVVTQSVPAVEGPPADVLKSLTGSTLADLVTRHFLHSSRPPRQQGQQGVLPPHVADLQGLIFSDASCQVAAGRRRSFHQSGVNVTDR